MKYFINNIPESGVGAVRIYLMAHFDRKQSATIIGLAEKNGVVVCVSPVSGSLITIEAAYV